RSPGSRASPSRSPPPRAARSPSSSRRSASSPSPARDSGSDGRRAPLARPSPGRRWVAAHAGAGMGRVLRGTLGRRTGRYPVHQSPHDARLGRWYNGNRADVYEFRTSSPVGGPFSHGFGASVLVNDSLGRRRTFYGLGYELQAWRGRATLGPYALAGVALGLSTDPATQELAAQWSLGGGVEWRPLGWLALGTEIRYRLEDRGPRGFWNPRSDARTGVRAVFGV